MPPTLSKPIEKLDPGQCKWCLRRREAANPIRKHNYADEQHLPFARSDGHECTPCRNAIKLLEKNPQQRQARYNRMCMYREERDLFGNAVGVWEHCYNCSEKGRLTSAQCEEVRAAGLTAAVVVAEPPRETTDA